MSKSLHENQENAANLKVDNMEIEAAQEIVKKYVVSEFNDLLKHKKNKNISKEEVKEALFSILSKMAQDGVLPYDKYMDFITKEERVEFQGNIVLKTGFDKTLDSLKIYDDKGNLAAEKGETLKDKLFYTAYKVFDAVGLSAIGLACKNMMSIENRTKSLVTAITNDIILENIKTKVPSHEEELVALNQRDNPSLDSPKTAQEIIDNSKDLVKLKPDQSQSVKAGKFAEALAASRQAKVAKSAAYKG